MGVPEELKQYNNRSLTVGWPILWRWHENNRNNNISQQVKSHGFCGESPGIVVFGGGNPCGNLDCKWNENSRWNSGEVFKSGLKWEGSFPQPVNILIHQRMTSNHHLDIFTQLGPFLCHYIAFWNFESNTREISTCKYSQGFQRESRRKCPHRKFPSFPPNLCREIMRKFLQGWSPGIPL